MVQGWAEADQRLARGRLKQHLEIAPALEEGLEVGGNERPRRPGLATHAPVLAQRQQQAVAERPGFGAIGLVDSYQFAVANQEQLIAVEGDRAPDEIALESLAVLTIGVDRNVVLPAFKHHRRRGQWRAPLPTLGDARVSRIGH